MSKNICPCCGGYSEYLDIEAERTQILCTGCEIKLYFPLHEIMNKLNVSKEEAYNLIKNSEGEKNKMKKVTIRLLGGMALEVLSIRSQDDPNRVVTNLSFNEIYKCITNSKFIVASTLEGSEYLINTNHITCIKKS